MYNDPSSSGTFLECFFRSRIWKGLMWMTQSRTGGRSVVASAVGKWKKSGFCLDALHPYRVVLALVWLLSSGYQTLWARLPNSYRSGMAIWTVGSNFSSLWNLIGFSQAGIHETHSAWYMASIVKARGYQPLNKLSKIRVQNYSFGVGNCGHLIACSFLHLCVLKFAPSIKTMSIKKGFERVSFSYV